MRSPIVLPRRAVIGGAAGLVAAHAWPARAQAEPLAQTTHGWVRGFAAGPAAAFLGVPYGAPTGGAARWLPPRPPEPWIGVRSAVDYGPICPQVFGAPLPEVTRLLQAEPMDEDCLRLNVFTPAADARARPVLVWLHGGGMSSGSGGEADAWGANLAAKQDVVVATVNHRLNVHGFLYLGEVFGETYARSGNVGLLDCVAALAWVRDNITAFGGDPGRVTLFGHSGGAAKTWTLAAMPAARGLVHRAGAVSGPVVSTGTVENAAANTRRLLNLLGVTTLEALQATPSGTLIEAMAQSRLQFGPVIDGLDIPAEPFSAEGLGPLRDIPMLLGSTATEATFFPGTPLDPIGPDALRELVRAAIRQTPAATDKAVAAFRAAYPGLPDHRIAQLMLTQFGIGDAVLQQAELRVGQGAAPTFLYHFARETPVRGGRLHSPHTLDAPYIFDALQRSAVFAGPYSAASQDLADRMGALWAAFARAGDPNGEGSGAWRPYDLTDRPTLVVDGGLRAVDDPLKPTREVVAALRSPARGLV